MVYVRPRNPQWNANIMQMRMVRADAVRIAGGWLARLGGTKMLPWVIAGALALYGYIQLVQLQRDLAASSQALAERVAAAATARSESLDQVIAGLVSVETARRDRAATYRRDQIGVGAARDESLDLPVPPAVLRILRPDAQPPCLEPACSGP